MTTRHPAFVAATALLLSACAGTPGPGDSGYPFNVSGTYTGQFIVDGNAFSSSMQLQTARGGIVSGQFSVTQPVQIGGPVEGTLVGDQLTFVARYENNPLTGCNGSAEGTVTVGEGGNTMVGSVTVIDCGASLPARMNFTR